MMEILSKAKVDFVEKLTSLPYFLFVLSFALFSDTYMLAVYKTTILQVSDTWLQSHITFSEILNYLGCIGFFYAALVPGVQFFVTLLAIRLASEFPISREGWIHVTTLKEFAIRTNNSIAYQECEKVLVQVRETKHLEGVSLSLVVLSVVGFVLSNAQNQGLFRFLYYGIQAFPWYVHLPLTLFIAPFLFFVVMVAFRGGRQYDGYVYFPSFESWEKES